MGCSGSKADPTTTSASTKRGAPDPQTAQEGKSAAHDSSPGASSVATGDDGNESHVSSPCSAPAPPVAQNAAAADEAESQSNDAADRLAKEFPDNPLAGVDFTIPEDCKEVELTKGITYCGQWANGLQNGVGRMKYPDGGFYLGQFKDGKPHGLGEFHAKDGSVYMGSFHEAKAHGYGVYKFRDGTVYYGAYVEDRREGRGRELQAEGGVEYVGQYLKGSKHGLGVLKSSNGEIYEGEFAHGEMEGQGKYIWADGRVYTGAWEKSKPHGLGDLKWPDGRHFIGQYKNGNIEGEGVLTWPDGRKYDGQWRNGRQNGIGKYWANANEYREAQFLDGIRIKWLGDPVIVNKSEPEAPVVPIQTEAPEVSVQDKVLDTFLK